MSTHFIDRYRIKFLLLLTAAITYSCSENSKQGTISGRLDHAGNITVYLQQISDGGEITIDSAKTDGSGAFSMKNPVKEADYYLLRTGQTNIIFLILYGGESVEITGDAKSMENTYTVNGSLDSRLIKELRQFDRRLTDSLNMVFSNYRQTDPAGADSAGRSLETYYTRTMGDYARNFVSTYPSSLASLSASKYLDQTKDMPLMEAMRDSLNKRLPGNKYVSDFTGLINELKMLPPGSEAPDIKLKTPEGKELALSSLRGKVVLVDFWASWCAPCRRENPNLVRIYAKHKNEGFEILGVSLDDNANAWKNAITQDGLAWPQVSELKKWDSGVVKDYHIDAIPFSVLIDAEGKIIAKGLRAEDLELKIQQALRKSS